ncbi:MAG: ATP-binding cassette domain-containing protein [Alphaproteobacteria bacterium]|nr:ATP-binding cassette domain-containing protein [Alphaproteobacteria bacterium]
MTLEARGLTRILPGPVQQVLVRDVDLSIAPGEFVAVSGPSGSGKSSLLYLLGLLDVPTAGEILVDGAPSAALAEDARASLRLARFGFVFQFHFLLPEFSALENVRLPMRRLGALAPEAAAARARALLESLDIGDQAGKRPDQLSGGQRQRVAIARALANDPAYLLADEPTGALDSANAAAVFGIFRTLAREGRTVIVVTHDEGLAQTASRRVRMKDGLVVADEGT